MGLLYILAWVLLGIGSIAVINTAVGLIGLGLFLAAAGVGYHMLVRGSTPFTDGQVFFASRWARDNLIFPTQVAVQPSQVIRHKERIIGAEEETISITQIASVKIVTSLLWSDIVIESTGGADPITCHGHLNADATTIKALIQQYQQEYYRQVPPQRSPIANLQPSPATRPDDVETPDTFTAPHPRFHGTLHLTVMGPPKPGATATHSITTHRYPLAHDPNTPPLHTVVLGLLHHAPPGSHLLITYVVSTPEGSPSHRDD